MGSEMRGPALSTLQELVRTFAEYDGVNAAPIASRHELLIVAVLALRGVEAIKRRNGEEVIPSAHEIGTTYCVGCGLQIGLNAATPEDLQRATNAVMEHIKECPQHPLGKLRGQLQNLAQDLLNRFPEAVLTRDVVLPIEEMLR